MVDVPPLSFPSAPVDDSSPRVVGQTGVEYVGRTKTDGPALWSYLCYIVGVSPDNPNVAEIVREKFEKLALIKDIIISRAYSDYDIQIKELRGLNSDPLRITVTAEDGRAWDIASLKDLDGVVRTQGHSANDLELTNVYLNSGQTDRRRCQMEGPGGVWIINANYDDITDVQSDILTINNTLNDMTSKSYIPTTALEANDKTILRMWGNSDSSGPRVQCDLSNGGFIICATTSDTSNLQTQIDDMKSKNYVPTTATGANDKTILRMWGNGDSDGPRLQCDLSDGGFIICATTSDISNLQNQINELKNK